MHKKILASVLALTLTAGAVALPSVESGIFQNTALSVNAAETFTSGDYKYQLLENGTAKICQYTGKDAKVNIPKTINGKKVTQIDGWAFKKNKTITSVVIPNTVTEICEPSYYGAFYDCENLETLTVSGSVKSIGGGAFENCTNLKNVTLGKGIKTIGNNAFFNCTNIKKLTVPDTVTKIESLAFSNCTSLSEITVPKNVNTIEDKAFGYKLVSGDKTFGKYEKISNFKIRCYKYTAADKYAKDNGFKVEYIKQNLSPVSITLTDKITVKRGKTVLKNGVDYKASIKYNSKTGKATVTVIGKGSYTGKVVKTFKVKPSQQKITGIKGLKKAVKVAYKKNPAASGYQIKLADNKNFKGARVVKVASKNATAKTIKSLKSNKKYYVKVRTYRKVGSKVYYGAWSKVKAVRTK